MNPDQPTDEALMKEACDGSESALASLLNRHRDRLERMVRLRLDRRLQARVDPADAEAAWVVYGRANLSRQSGHLEHLARLRQA